MKKIVYIIIIALFITAVINNLLLTEVKTNSDWFVNPKMNGDVPGNEGPLIAMGRLYSVKPTPFISLAHYADNIRQKVPLFLVITDFDIKWREPSGGTSFRMVNDGGGGFSGDYVGAFECEGKKIVVPIEIPYSGYYCQMPEITEDNVFIMKRDGSFELLPLNIRTNEQMHNVFSLLRSEEVDDLVGAVTNILSIQQNNSKAEPSGDGSADR